MLAANRRVNGSQGEQEIRRYAGVSHRLREGGALKWTRLAAEWSNRYQVIAFGYRYDQAGIWHAGQADTRVRGTEHPGGWGTVAQVGQDDLLPLLCAR